MKSKIEVSWKSHLHKFDCVARYFFIRFQTVKHLIVFGSEFLIRNILFPSNAREIHIRVAMMVEWLILFFLLSYWIPRVECKSFASIGVGKFKWRHLWMGGLTFVFAMGAMVISGILLEANGLEPIRSLQTVLKSYSPTTLLGLFLTGTILEEILYRGYLIERLAGLMGQLWLAGLLSWIAFTLVHLKFFGLGPTIDVSIFSAALVLLYLKERCIWPCMVAHGINNALSYLIFPLIMP
jgi:membrane protease YdiL (CAAX protease family)